MKLARISALVLVMGIVAFAVLGGTTVSGSLTAPRGAAPHPPLSGGASSVDELLGKFVKALEANDGDAIAALRVTEDEYRKIIMPGSVKPGEPPQKLSPKADEYFWQALDTRSMYTERSLLVGFKDRKYRIKNVTWRKGIDEYAWYRCYDRLEMTLVDEGGTEHTLVTGSVAEVDGRFKFISFIRD